MDNEATKTASAPSAQKKRKARLEKNYWGYIFIAPFFLVYLTFSAYPILSTFFYAFTFRPVSDSEFGTKGHEITYEHPIDPETGELDMNPINAIEIDNVFMEGEDWSKFQFVGLNNFYYKGSGYRYWYDTGQNEIRREYMQKADNGIFLDKGWMESFGNTFLIWIIGFIPQIGLALLLAAWFTDEKVKVKGQGFFKVVFYMPNIMTAATIGYLFYMLSTQNGIFHIIAMSLGIVDSASALAGPIYSRGIVAFINFWMWYGNTMIIMIAGILGINPALFEAANIDGASGNQTFWGITVPLIRPILTFNLVQSLVGGMQMFDVPFIISGITGSPHANYARVIMTTIKMNSAGLMGQSESGAGFARASAAAVLVFAITVVFSVLIFQLMKDRSEAKYLRKMKKLAAMQAQTGGAH